MKDEKTDIPGVQRRSPGLITVVELRSEKIALLDLSKIKEKLHNYINLLVAVLPVHADQYPLEISH